PTTSDTDDDKLKAPNAFLLMLEGRAPWEYAAMLAAMPWLRRLPQGDGHPVLVFPGLGAADFTTWPLRRFLEGRGYKTYPWQQGFNFGPRDGVLDGCIAPTTSIYSKTDGIVAWRCSVNEVGPLAENIEVHASHVGMGMNPIALYAVADRLAQDPKRWQPFDASGARRWFFRTGMASAT